MGNPLNDAAMKKLAYIFALVAAAVALSSCVKDLQESFSGPEVTVSFTAGAPQTRTAFTEPDGNTYPVLWTENDQKVALALNYAAVVPATVSPSADFKTASFTATFAEATAPFTFYLISPASAAVGISSKYYDWTVDVPIVQTPLAKSVDEAAQILVSKSDAYTEIPAKVTFSLEHWTAYGKLTLTNLALDGAEIEAVDLTSEVPWAGRWWYYPDENRIEAHPGAETITINTKATEDLWFACAPVDLSEKKLTVAVKTDKGTYTKEITLPADRKFESGKIARFTVDMAGIKPTVPIEYVLVKDVAELTVGSKVVIAAADYNTAISTTQDGNNRPQTAVTKDGDKIVDPGIAVEIFTVEEGTTAGTFAFKASGTEGYLYAVSGKNYLRTSATKSEEGDWKVTIQDKSTVIANTKTERFIRYNKGNSIFAAYGATSSVKDSVAIYKLADTPAPEKKLTIKRVWGKYPMANDTPWTAEFKDVAGYVKGNDRAVAADDDYVYVVGASSSTSGILAISIADPTQVKNVNMTGVAGGLFATACVRTIKDPATGKYILLAGSLAYDGDFTFNVYAYENGIDAAPTKILSWNTNNRRFGDIFSVAGDWQNGELWIRINGEASTTIFWKIQNGKIASDPIGGGIGYAASYGMGAVYKYSLGANQILLETPNVGLCYNYTASTWIESSSGVVWDKVDQSVMCRKFGVTPFTFDGKKYIAYTQMGKYTDPKNGARARVKIIEDQGSAETFRNSLEADKVVYECPIQNRNDNASTAAEFDEVYFLDAPSFAGQVLGSCSVVEKADAVLIVSHLYNVGVSVFKMTLE